MKKHHHRLAIRRKPVDTIVSTAGAESLAVMATDGDTGVDTVVKWKCSIVS